MALGELMEIVSEVARETGLPVVLLRGPSRRRDIFAARAEAMRRMRETGRYSLPQIGRFFGRDHTTVLNALRVATGEGRATTCPSCGGRVRRNKEAA